jgi:APA family basic amino acid/polyamine antiporter
MMAAAIMISTFGTVNALILTGPRAYYAMARQGLFFRFAGRLNHAKVPASALWIQGIWAILLVVPRTFDSATHTYGNLYSSLLDYVISAALVFYVLTVASVFRFRLKQPNAVRPYRVPGYPLVPFAYVLAATTILFALFAYRPTTTWPGLVIVVLGVPLYLLLQRRNARAIRA